MVISIRCACDVAQRARRRQAWAQRPRSICRAAPNASASSPMPHVSKKTFLPTSPTSQRLDFRFDHARGIDRLERDPKTIGHVHEAAEREDAQGDVALEKRLRGGRDGAVAARDDDRRETLTDRGLRELRRCWMLGTGLTRLDHEPRRPKQPNAFSEITVLRGPFSGGGIVDQERALTHRVSLMARVRPPQALAVW